MTAQAATRIAALMKIEDETISYAGLMFGVVLFCKLPTQTEPTHEESNTVDTVDDLQQRASVGRDDNPREYEGGGWLHCGRRMLAKLYDAAARPRQGGTKKRSS